MDMHPWSLLPFLYVAQGYDWLWQTVGPVWLHVGIYGAAFWILRRA